MKPITVLILVALGAWAYFGFPSPETLMHWSSAKKDCVDFAEKHRDTLFYGSAQKKIRAMDDWIKNGKVVVEVGAISDDGSFTPRLCVIGGGTIQIVSILENASYRCTTAADSLILHRVFVMA